MSILMGILWEEKPFLVKLLPIVLTSFAFESIQYIGAVRVSAITDLITNSLRGIIGLVIASVLPLIFRKKWRALINIICSIGFVLLGVLSLLLFKVHGFFTDIRLRPEGKHVIIVKIKYKWRKVWK